jgi:hypothetical protein
MRRLLLFITLTTLVVLGLVNASAALADNPRTLVSSVNERTPFSVTYYCTPENVHIEGEMHWVLKAWKEGVDGPTQVVAILSIKGTGVGETTGARYRFNQSYNRTLNTYHLPAVSTDVYTYNLIGQGRAPNHKLKIVSHVTINSNNMNEQNHSVEVTGCE